MTLPKTVLRLSFQGLSNIIRGICHVLFGLCLFAGALAAQSERHTLAPGEVHVEAVRQQKTGTQYILRGKALLETDTFLLRADEIDYDEKTEQAEARGQVYLKNFEGGEELWADRAEYDVGEETGRFFNVRGKAQGNLDVRPGLLTTTNPFYFEGRWAERLKDRYILYQGFITNCKVPGPWWKLAAPKFDVIPNDRALAYKSVFWLRGVPILYAPFFRKSLERVPRRSGLLTPNIGNSSTRGKMVGVGYYWALGRSYDASYRNQYFTERGFAHTVNFRGKPNPVSDFDFYFYGVNDRGLEQDNGERVKQGGVLFSFRGQTELPDGWYGRTDINYLSSMTFRQAFTETFIEAVASEVHAVGYLSKDWSTYNVDFAFNRVQAFRFSGFSENERVSIRKLPELTFMSRDRRLFRDVPVWVSWESSAGLLRRSQPLFQTRQFVDRADLYPRVMTALRWKDINIIPSFAVRETHWGESREGTDILGRNVNRHGREFSVAIVPPSLARVYNGAGWLGEKLKHVVEPRVSFRHVRGVGDAFDSYIRFDETELYSNTTEAEVSLTNRLYAKRNGNVEEVLSWQLWQRRYFDKDFGGVVVEGQRNVLLSSLELTPYAFLDRPRVYSPVVSVLRVSPRPGYGLEWRADYDPARDRPLTNSTISGDARFGQLFMNVGHSFVRRIRLGTEPDGTERYLTPAANEIRGLVGFGNDNRRGWNGAFSAIYNYVTNQMVHATTQVTYNTECCGFSFQYKRLGFRNDNWWGFSFTVANIGAFGTLKKQERLF